MTSTFTRLSIILCLYAGATLVSRAPRSAIPSTTRRINSQDAGHDSLISVAQSIVLGHSLLSNEPAVPLRTPSVLLVVKRSYRKRNPTYITKERTDTNDDSQAAMTAVTPPNDALARRHAEVAPSTPPPPKQNYKGFIAGVFSGIAKLSG